MKLQLLSIVVLALLLNAGCKKNNDQAPEKVILLSQSIADDGTTKDTSNYKYDDNNRLVEMYDKYRDEKYVYDNFDRITERDNFSIKNGSVDVTSGAKYIYTYPTTSTVVESINYISNGAVYEQRTGTFTLNSLKQVINIDFGNNGYYLFLYDDSGNLLLSWLYDNTARLLDKDSYDYDQKKNPYINIKGNLSQLLIIPYINNSIVSKTSILYSNTAVTSSNKITNSYEYNNDNYPTKITQVVSLATKTPYTQTFYLKYISK